MSTRRPSQAALIRLRDRVYFAGGHLTALSGLEGWQHSCWSPWSAGTDVPAVIPRAIPRGISHSALCVMTTTIHCRDVVRSSANATSQQLLSPLLQANLWIKC